MRIAMLSGGKDSLYAAFKAWPVDLGLMLVYEAPRPSPHLLNLAKSVETLLAAGIPVVVLRLGRSGGRGDIVRLLSKLGVSEIVAGDVYIEDHLKYMEGVAGEIGARLLEPLWGRSSEELVYEIFNDGFESLIIGIDARLSEWISRRLDRGNVEKFVSHALSMGVDPLGENGEYHTLVVESPLHSRKLGYRVLRYEDLQGYVVARVV